MRRKRNSGFTIIELLIVVAIIGILATIAIANYFSALHRARQKRTMSDIRTVASAWEARASETRSFNSAGFTFPTTVKTYDEMRAALVPEYIREVPKYDGWGRPYEYGALGLVYAIRSSGRDGVYEGTEYVPGTAENPDCDLVFANGNFVRYADVPQGE